MEKKIIGSFTCLACGTTHNLYAEITKAEGTKAESTKAASQHENESSTINYQSSKFASQLAQLAAKGIDISCYQSVKVFDEDERLVRKNADGSMVFVSIDDPIFKRINERGFTYNSHLFKQYVAAHLLALSWNEESRNIDGKKFTNAINGMSSVRRPFEIVITKLNGMAAMQRNNDIKALNDEIRYYNKSLCIDMMDWYIDKFLPKYVAELKVRKCKGKEYIYSKFFGKLLGEKGKYRGTFLTEMPKVYDRYSEIKQKLSDCNEKDFLTMRNIMGKFTDVIVRADHIKSCSYEHGVWKYEYRDVVAPCFADAYKGYGAFFTGQNLIEFHNCLIGGVEDGTNNAEVSMKMWRKMSDEHKAEPWWMFGALKRLIADNGFDYEAKREEWKASAEARRLKHEG